MRYFVSYAYGGIRHAHDQEMFIIPKITHDNFDESIEQFKLLIKQKHSKLCFDNQDGFPEMIAITFWKEI